MTQLTQDLLINNVLAEIDRLTRRVEALERQIADTARDDFGIVTDIDDGRRYRLHIRRNVDYGDLPQLIARRIKEGS